MRTTSSVTSISWIPSEAMTGPMRVPMDLGIGHYDPEPPDEIDQATLDSLLESDRLRFANRLEAWIEVENGEITDAGYSGRALVGATTARFGVGSMTFPGVGYPLIREDPLIEGGVARFVQTAGGRTGAPFPHRIDHPPYVRISGPTAWTTLALEIGVDGETGFEVVGASPFPRHFIYDAQGKLAEQSGVIDFAEWEKVHDHDHSPWHEVQHEALVAEAESAAERAVSEHLGTVKGHIRKLNPDELLTKQGERSVELYLIVDGLLEVEIDGDVVAEIGPGAVVGEAAILEEGVRTATLRTRTAAKVGVFGPDALDPEELARVAAGHHRET